MNCKGISDNKKDDKKVTSVAIDNGGTKAVAIRFDADFIPLATVRTGSLRGNTTPEAVVKARIDEIISGLGLRSGDALDSVSGSFPRTFEEVFRKKLTVSEFRYYYELLPGIAGAEIFDDSLMAICGTGVSVFSYIGGEMTIYGGYGSLISDEGSGYWIARQAFNAAIHDYEGRGRKTALTDIITQKYAGNGIGDFRDAVFSIYKRKYDSLVTELASLTPLVAEAARTDEVAAEIMRDAGRLVADQLAALVRNKNIKKELPVVITGSVWKRNPVLLGAFKEVVEKEIPGSYIVIPKYEPVVGSVILNMVEKNRAEGIQGLTDGNRQVLRDMYRDFEYRI